MNLTDKVSIPAAVMARDLGTETVILNLDSGVYFGLDQECAARADQRGNRAPRGKRRTLCRVRSMSDKHGSGGRI